MPKRRSKKLTSRAASPSLTDDLLGHLTEDLVVEILSRLPAKSVCRSKCVSRAWRSLITRPEYRGKLRQTLAGFYYKQFGVHGSAADLRFTSALARAPRGRNPLTTFSYYDCQPRCRLVRLIDSRGGLLLLRCSSTWEDFHYVVCNPATKQWVALPESGQAGHMFVARLGFDPAVSPHFQVFEFLNVPTSIPGVQVFSCFTPGVKMYLSSIGAWVRNEWNGGARRVAVASSPTVFLNGCLHLLTTEYASPMAATGELTIVVFDTEGKIRRNIAVPDGPHCLDEGFIHLSQGCLHFANFERLDAGSRLAHYALDNYDSQECILNHTAAEIGQVFPNRSFTLGIDVVWVGIHPDCNLVFFTLGRDKTLMCYDMERKRAQVIRDLGNQTEPPHLPYVPFYAELEALDT